MSTSALAAKPQPSVAVAIPAYTMDRWELLVRSVDSVRAQTVPVEAIVLCIDHNDALLDRARREWHGAREPEVIVIPNRHSTDLERVAAHEAAHGSRRRFGAGSARNTAADAVRADVIAYLDDDARAEPDWIERVLDVFSSESVVAVGGRPVPDYETARPRWYPGNFDWVFGCAYDGLPKAVQPLRRLLGANMAVRRPAFEAVGGFIESDFDDLNLCTRLIARFGVESVVYTPFAVAHHFVTAERVTWRYFWRRCYFVNREKVRAFKRIGAAANLIAERQFVFYALSRQVGLTLRRLSRGDIHALYAFGAMIAGIALAGLGHLRGQIDCALARRSDSGTDADSEMSLAGLEEATVHHPSSPPAKEALRDSDESGPGTDAQTGSPLVSVVVPTIGRASVADAISSVLTQTYTHTEVIVVYDGADGELALEPPTDGRVKVIATGERRGEGPARTLGVRMATGKYLALLDDDDTWTARKLDVQVEMLERLGRSAANVVCVSRFRLVDEQGCGSFVAPKRLIQPDEALADYLFHRRWVRWGEAVIHPSTLICERQLAASTPWFQGPVHQDWDWLLRLAAERNAKVIMAPEPLVNVTQTIGSASRSTKWRESLAWVSRSRLLTKRQQADVLLCTTAAFARTAGDRRAVAKIARHAFVEGPPGLRACVFFVAFQLLSPRLLTRLARAMPTSVRARPS